MQSSLWDLITSTAHAEVIRSRSHLSSMDFRRANYVNYTNSNRRNLFTLSFGEHVFYEFMLSGAVQCELFSCIVLRN